MKILSGIRPSGKLHLGNYIGAILPAIKYDADILIAEYHEPFGDAVELFTELRRYFKGVIVHQYHSFSAKRYFELLSVTPSGLLSHMPQYKAKEKTANMFVYPVLMAHDLVGYDKVIVGLDQMPHIEFARDILPKIGETCPEPIYEGGKVMDLRHPQRKMSKSMPESCLFLSDTPDVIEHKIRKAVTTPEGRTNLEFICTALGKDVPSPNSELKDVITKAVLRVVTQ